MFILIIIFILFLLFLLSTYQYYKKYQTELRIIKEGDNYFATTYIKKSDFNDIYNKPLVFLNKKIKYEIITIDDYFYLETEYKLLTLKVDLDKIYLKENNILLSHFETKKTTLISEALEFIKKGLSG
jgi:uncharacterized protein YpmS